MLKEAVGSYKRYPVEKTVALGGVALMGESMGDAWIQAHQPLETGQTVTEWRENFDQRVSLDSMLTGTGLIIVGVCALVVIHRRMRRFTILRGLGSGR